MGVGAGTLENVDLETATINGEFWRGRRVFLTGHTGFKGGWLAKWLSTLGATVTGYSGSPPSEPNLFETAGIGNLLNHISGDITDVAELESAMVKAEPEIVFHMAAQPLVRYSYEQPVETYASNLMGTLHVLQAALRANAQAFVNITTDKCYENKEWIWPYRENEPLGGHDPYSASKACAEILTSSFRLSYLKNQDSMRLASVRAGNVIGGGDWGKDRLVPDIMMAFASQKPVHIRNPVATRPWQHVLDALSGYMLLAQNLMQTDGYKYAQAWNFGPDTTGQVSVGTLARKIKKIWGDKAKIEFAKVPSGAHEAKFLSLDSTKARSQLKWQPSWTFDETLEKTVDWYKNYYLLSKEDKLRTDTVSELMAKQIAEYSIVPTVK